MPHHMVAAFWNALGVAFPMVGASIGAAPQFRIAPRLVVAEGRLAGERFSIAELSLEQMDAAKAQWVDLAGRALDPNAFYEPGFALSAARHFPVKSRPHFIVVREKDGRMMGVFPIVSPNPLFGDGLIRLWLHKQAALATPLVDRDAPVETILAFLDWLEQRSYCAGVVFARTQSNGRFHEALRVAAAQQERGAKILESFERAALLSGEGGADELCARGGSKNRVNELHRQRRRLREMGELSYHSHSTAEEVRAATEEFLALEASGWKAHRGALLSQASLTTFLRSATRMLAREGRCKIVSLRVDGRAIAMVIMLESQGHSYCWKIAYDEAYRAQAPGIQLVYEQTRAQLARPDIEITDSCAIANHPMIDRLWPDRVGVCDIAVQLQKGREDDFLASCSADRRRRRVRDLAKRAAYRVLRRKAV